MATIENLKLSMNQMGNDPFLNASLDFDVRFSDAEVRLGLNYYVHAKLFERDGWRDQYVMWQNGADSFQVQAMQKGEQDLADDPVRAFWGKTITPNGQNRMHVQLNRGFPMPEGQDHPSDRGNHDLEFFAIVQVASELAPATMFSNQVNTKSPVMAS
ncbi:hypothetical protein IQ266_06060 [filamentous cyanobacterium LEGE 11480]|uniref:Uncharacterized protein n=1 Tax=Romeriopsis navalis LEGE 11480 TaxID=2777977 RepID=A0A928Z1G3_9CYAN|nr:hypothetical protein [Romeriopsis navalis]MBE9029326.1 hypothetical protein [Romeriopsis navalis LEGE 11480]